MHGKGDANLTNRGHIRIASGAAWIEVRTDFGAMQRQAAWGLEQQLAAAFQVSAVQTGFIPRRKEHCDLPHFHSVR